MKIIFWAVDCQKDFMNKDGALYVEGAESIKPNLKILTQFAKENNIMVVNTRDWHDERDKELSENPDFINTFPQHCIHGSEGAEFIEETKPDKIITTGSNELYYGLDAPVLNIYARNIVIDKNKFDVFAGNPDTDKFLNFINPDLVVVYGVATNVCVHHAVMGLTKQVKEIWVVDDAIKELPNIPIEPIFKEWRNHFICWDNTKDLLAYIKANL